MALPALVDTWRFSMNNAMTAAANDTAQHSRLVLAFKDALKGNIEGGGGALTWTDSAGAGASAPAALWQTRGSCDGSGAFGNNDNTDRWSVGATDVSIGFGNNRSWQVLEHTVLGLHMLIDCRTSNAGNAHRNLGSNAANPNTNGIRISHDGYFAANGGADGSDTSAPTSGDTDIRISEERDQDSYDTLRPSFGNFSGGIAHKYHVIANTAGTRWRILFYRNGFCAAIFVLDVPQDPVVIPNGVVGGVPTHTWNGDDKPWTAFWIGADLDNPSNRATEHDALYNYARANTKLANITTNTQNSARRPSFSQEHHGDSDTPLSRLGVSGLTGERPFGPIGIVSADSGFEGRCGILTDMYWGNDTDQGVAEGDNYPDDLTRSWTSYGGLILPNNGQVIQTT
jgi:hypothetical protein